MANRLQGKVAVVTGAGRGIGREIALRLARDGAAVVVNDLDDAPAKETIALIERLGGRAVACNGDVNCAPPRRVLQHGRFLLEAAGRNGMKDQSDDDQHAGDGEHPAARLRSAGLSKVGWSHSRKLVSRRSAPWRLR